MQRAGAYHILVAVESFSESKLSVLETHYVAVGVLAVHFIFDVLAVQQFPERHIHFTHILRLIVYRAPDCYLNGVGGDFESAAIEGDFRHLACLAVLVKGRPVEEDSFLTVLGEGLLDLLEIGNVGPLLLEIV